MVGMILADTTIWVDHFRVSNLQLKQLLEDERIATHPFIIAELALGSLNQRAETLKALDHLPPVPVARLHEVRRMIEMRSLSSRGIGFVDAHLIASCLIDSPTRLWTHDKRLAQVAASLGVAASFS